MSVDEYSSILMNSPDIKEFHCHALFMKNIIKHLINKLIIVLSFLSVLLILLNVIAE